MESIWAEVTEEGYLKINNIPFYSKEISLGDIVSGIQMEEFNVNFYAINIPIQVDIEEIYLFLDEFVETDDLDYDTGYLAQ